MTQIADVNEIRRAASVLMGNGQVTELRALGVRRNGNGYAYTASGYFNDPEAVVTEAEKLSGSAEGVYLTPNPVNPDLLARACNRVRQMGKTDHSTSDSDVVRRHWLMVDCDPVRPSGISSTDAEHARAMQKARDIWNALLDTGFPEPVLADSGNGAHLLYRVDLPTDDSGLIRRCLEALSFRFDDDSVHVDKTVFNPARIWKLYGTRVRKGDDLPERPHRLSKMEFIPKTLELVTTEALESLADWVPVEPKPERRTPSGFELDRWIADHGVPVGQPEPWKDGRRWVFDVCPWDPSHTNRSAFILQFGSGGIAAGCHHNGCSGRGWRELRILYEPDAYSHETSAIPAHEPDTEHTDTAPAFATVLTHHDLVTGDLPPIPWLVEGLIPEGGICLLAGDSGVGKSWLSFHLAQTVAAGIPLLGQFPTERGAVLYLDAESGENLVRRRFKKLWRGLTEEHPGLASDIPVGLMLSAVNMDETGCAALTKRIRQDSTALVILDPMIHFGSGDENNAREVAAFLDGLRGVARETGAAFLLVHHVRKESRMASNAAGQMIRGSSAIRGVMDSILYVRKLNDGRLHVEHDKSRHAEALPSFLVEITDPDEETTCITYAGESGTSAENRQEVAEAVILRTIADGGGTAKRKVILEQCKAEGVSERTTASALKTMTEASKVNKCQHGKEVEYSFAESVKPLALDENW